MDARTQHRITVEPFHGTVNVMFSDAMIASTKSALLLREEGHDPVFYVPFEDIYFDFLTRSNTATRCPYKGTASYWHVQAVGEAATDVMWSYETPLAEVEAIREHGAFTPGKMRIEAIPDEDPLHTPHAP